MEALILRRNYPVPVTFSDLRRAHAIVWRKFGRLCSHLQFILGKPRIGVDWVAALKEATGATDDVYAAVDGREVHVANLVGAGMEPNWVGAWPANSGRMYIGVANIIEVADEAGYWERPHEVRLELQERTPSLKAIDAVVQRSQVEAEVRRGL